MIDTVIASTAADWRAWLARHGRSEKEAWLVIYHQDSGTPSVRYHEAIEHALCYGWIDSHARKRDADSSYLRFTPRNSHRNIPTSTVARRDPPMLSPRVWKAAPGWAPPRRGCPFLPWNLGGARR